MWFANAWSRSSSPRPVSRLGPGRQADHAHELSGRDHRRVDRRAPAGVATGARAVDELSAALQRGAAQRSLPERHALGVMMVAVLVAFAHDRGAAQGHSVLLGEEDRAPVDVVERHQPRQQDRQGRVGLPGGQVGPGPRPAGGGCRRRRRAGPGAGGRGVSRRRSAGRRSRCAGRRARPPAPGWRRRAWTSRCGCACAPSRATARGPAAIWAPLSPPASRPRISRSRTDRGAPCTRREPGTPSLTPTLVTSVARVSGRPGSQSARCSTASGSVRVSVKRSPSRGPAVLLDGEAYLLRRLPLTAIAVMHEPVLGI